MDNGRHERTPLDEQDFFTVIDLRDFTFGLPAHWHGDFELNMVVGARGERLVGDSREAFDELDVVLLGPGLPHEWRVEAQKGRMVCIHFHAHNLAHPAAEKRIFLAIRDLLARSRQGVAFPPQALPAIRDRILGLVAPPRFPGALSFIAMLEELARTPNCKLLASPGYAPAVTSAPERHPRTAAILEYIENNFRKPIKLADAAHVARMSESAFSHYFKRNTGRNFVDHLADVRIDHAARMLYETALSVNDICGECGFTNTANFIRVFKKRRTMPPAQYREWVRGAVMKY